jgi:D-aminopeptidase
VQGLFDDIIAGFPEEQKIAPGRQLFEDMRRAATAEAKAAIKND